MAGSPYGELKSAPGSSSKDSGGGGFGGLLAPVKFVENLSKDVYETAIGTPAGLYKLATDPEEALKVTAEGIWNDWKPLATGHPGEWAHNFFNHPLGPILDVASIFTGGATAVGKGASAIAKAGEAGAVRSAAKELGIEAEKRVGPRGAPKYVANRIDSVEQAARDSFRTNTTVGKLADFHNNPGTLVYKDVPGRAGRRGTLDQVAAQADIEMPTAIGTAQRLRQETIHTLAQKMGGRFAQTPYEVHAARQFGEGVVAVQSTLGLYDHLLNRLYDTKTGLFRTGQVQRMYDEYENNIISHADKNNLIVPIEEFAAGAVKGGKWEPRMWGGLSTRQHILKDRAYVGADGKLAKRKAFRHGKGLSLEQNLHYVKDDFAHIGRRFTSGETRAIDGAKLNGLLGVEKYTPGKQYAVVLHKPSNMALGRNVGEGLSTAGRMLTKGTYMWKMALLPTSPRFFLNNFVGNGAMAVFAHPASVLAIREAWRQIHGDKSVATLDRQLESLAEGQGLNNWFRQLHGDQAGQGLYHSAGISASPKTRQGQYAAAMGERPVSMLKTATGRKLEAKAAKVYGFVGKYAETSYRAAIASKLYLKNHEVQKMIADNLEKHPEWATERAMNDAILRFGRANPQYVKFVSKSVEDVMGNYFSLLGPERTTRRYISPFYTWQRHILRNGTKMALDKPIRTTAAVSLGRTGFAASDEWLGENAPDWLRSYIPGFQAPGLDPGDVNRVSLVNTQGANPYSQLGEEFNTLRAGLGAITGDESAPTLGETFGGLLNPGIQAGVQALTNKNMLTGAPISSGDALTSPITNLPHYQFFKRSLFPDQYKEPTMFGKTPAETFYGWLGIPLKDLWKQRAAELGIEAKRKEG